MGGFIRVYGRRTAATVVLIVVILLLFWRFVDAGEVARQLRQTDAGLAAAASVALLGSMGAYARRWQIIMSEQSPWWATFHAANAGHAANILLPLRAGEAVRVVALARRKEAGAAAIASSIVVERLFEQLMRGLALAAAVAAGTGLGLSGTTVVGGLILFGLVVTTLTWAARHPEAVAQWAGRWLGRLTRLSPERVRGVMLSFLAGLEALGEPGRVGRVGLWSLLTWSGWLLFHYLCLLALPLGVVQGERLALALAALALAPPSAATQPGLYHASLVAPLALAGFDESALTAYAVLMHGLQMVWMVGLGAWGVARIGRS